jgi:MYXO-CTERM domain-containing protein
VRVAWLSVAAGAATIALARDASANGRFPAASEIFFSPTDLSFVGIRATFGILLSHDGGTTWAWLCEDAIGLGPKTEEDPPLAMTAGGSLIAALPFGLAVSTDSGCDWSFVGGALSGQVVADIAVRPDNPHAVIAVTATYGADAGEGGASGYDQQVYESIDDGAHWSPLGALIDPSALVTTIDVAASDPDRLYASAIRHGATPPSASLFVSTNAGASWTEYPAPFDMTRGSTAIFIAAVDPTNADRVYLRSDGDSQLSVTSDAGKTWSTPLSIEDPMLGFALSSDGSTVYAGSVAAGLLVADATTLSFQQVSGIHVQCLASSDGGLWACSDEPSGFIAGQSGNGGASFVPKLRNLLDIGAPIACPASAEANLCTSFDYDAMPPYDPFTALCTNLDACMQSAPLPPLAATCVDAGRCTEAAGDAGPPASPTGSKACGCSTAGGQGAAGVALATALLGIAVRRRTKASP